MPSITLQQNEPINRIERKAKTRIKSTESPKSLPPKDQEIYTQLGEKLEKQLASWG